VLPQDPQLCMGKIVLWNFGFSITYGSLFIKTFRLHKIFNNIVLRVMVISNLDLCLRLLAIVAVDAFIFIIWGAVSPFSIKSPDERLCLSDSSDAYVGVLIAIKGLLIGAGAVLTFKIRKIPSGFNESFYIALAIYNTLFLGIVWLAISYGFGSSLPEASNAVFVAGLTLFGCVSTLGFLFGPKIYAIYSPNQGGKSFASSMVTAKSSKPGKSGYNNMEGSRKSGRDESTASVGDDGKSSGERTSRGESSATDETKAAGSLDQQFSDLQSKLEKSIRSIQKKEEELTKAQETAASLAAELGEVNLKLQAEPGNKNAARTKELMEMAEKVRIVL